MEMLTDRQKDIENAVNNVAEYMKTAIGPDYALYYLSNRLMDALERAPEYYTDAVIDIFNGYELEND
jgi:hypothetical protein